MFSRHVFGFWAVKEAPEAHLRELPSPEEVFIRQIKYLMNIT